LIREGIRREIRAEAIKLLERRGKNDSAALQIEAPIRNLDDTLSNEVYSERTTRDERC
jgi:hypothetical protein